MLRKLLAIFGFVTFLLWANVPAQASAIINIDQVGPDVVATIAGIINTEGLTFSYAYTYNQAGIIAGADKFDGLVGAGESGMVAIYYYVADPVPVGAGHVGNAIGLDGFFQQEASVPVARILAVNRKGHTGGLSEHEQSMPGCSGCHIASLNQSGSRKS